MHKSNETTARTHSRRLVDEPCSFVLQFSERGVDVRNLDGNMVHSRPALSEKFSHSSVGTQRLEQLAGERRTIVLYEAPHRLARTLADLEDVCGGSRRVAVARELAAMVIELEPAVVEEHTWLAGMLGTSIL